MRLALLATGFADYSLGLATALAPRHQVLVLADAGSLAREGVTIPTIETLRVEPFRQHSLVHRWAGALRLSARLAAFRPDAVIAHEHAHPHITALLRQARHRAALALIVHDPGPHPGRDAAFAAARIHEIMAQRGAADLLVVHGEACARRLRERIGVGAPIQAIAHGPILVPAAVGPPPGARRVLTFGRMEAYKGLETLLDACGRLHARGDGVALELVGEGPELDRLAAPIRALPACRVRRGFADRATLQDALARADVVAAAYLEASQSGVVAAAFANARPVIASRVGGLGEVVRPGLNGALVGAGDAAQLAEALARTLAGSNTLWRGAAATAADQIAWSRAAEALEPTLIAARRLRTPPREAAA